MAEIRRVIGSEFLNKGIDISHLEEAEKTGHEISCAGLDGTKVIISVTQDTISLREEKDFLFMASLNGDTIHFIINNQNDIEKSNTIFPRQLVVFSLNKWGLRVKTVRASWKADWGVNTVQYKEALRVGKSPTDAAFSTWTGSTVGSLGFSRVTKIEEIEEKNEKWTYVYFER